MTNLFLYPMFWALWIATAIAVSIQVIRPLVTGKELLGFPFVAGLAWLYFYLFMAFDVGIGLRDFVPDTALCLGQFVALTSYLGLVAGWKAALRKNSAVRMRPDQNQYPADSLWLGGTLFLLTGIIGQYTLMQQEITDWSNVSAYWHMLYLIGYPGAALCVAGILRTPPQKRKFRILLLAVAVAVLQFPFLMGARRGPLFPAVIMLCFAPILFSGKRPRRLFVLSVLGGVGMAMLLFVAIRPYASRDSTTNALTGGFLNGLSNLTAKDVISSKAGQLADNEYAYHCAAVWTIFRTGRYQYGTGYLTLLVHWIPRQIWPDKPGLEEGFFPSYYGEVSNEMGWHVTGGAAWGGAADVFSEFGFLSPLFWGAMAYFVGRSYQRALSNRLGEKMAYLGFLAGTHWLVAQGFGPAFVPMCIFIIPPFVFLRFARVDPAALRRLSAVPINRRRRMDNPMTPQRAVANGMPIERTIGSGMSTV